MLLPERALSFLWFACGTRWREFKVFLAAQAFESQRADYYEYLADLTEVTSGTKTLQSVFQDDALRYGSESARGALSKVWLERFPQAGGDLFSTWFGTLPIQDLLAIKSAQYSGAQALMNTLRQLASIVKLLDVARSLLFTTAFVGVAGLIMACASILSIPFFTARHLRKVFASVPPEYFESWTRSLFAMATWLETAWPYATVVLVATSILFIWSFANWTGTFRDSLDRWGPWAFYRRTQTVRFVSLLAVTLNPSGSYGTRLRDAIALQALGATPWFSMHLNIMMTRLDLGAHTVDALDTGLIDQEIWWYFTDMLQTLGLDEALYRTRQRIEVSALKQIKTQAIFLRWSLLLLALAIVLGVAFWHIRVFEELRQALSLHYSR